MHTECHKQGDETQIWNARSGAIGIASRKVVTGYHLQVMTNGALEAKSQEPCCHRDPHFKFKDARKNEPVVARGWIFESSVNLSSFDTFFHRAPFRAFFATGHVASHATWNRVKKLTALVTRNAWMSIIETTMRVVVVLACLVALATAAPCRQAWVAIPRGGASDYGSELEIVKSSVLEKAIESVGYGCHTLQYHHDVMCSVHCFSLVVFY
jgi:hypothetical protein